jgi:hypothetical protein
MHIEGKLVHILPAPLAGYVMVLDDHMRQHHPSTTESRAWAHIREELIRAHKQQVQKGAVQ